MTTMQDQTNDEERARTQPFAGWLQNVRKGALHAELSEKLAELAVACLETGKVGSLSLTVKLAPNKDGVTLQASDAVKLTKPEHERATTMFFSDEEGNLTRTNPYQQELPLKAVPVHDADGETTAFATVNEDTGEVRQLHD